MHNEEPVVVSFSSFITFLTSFHFFPLFPSSTPKKCVHFQVLLHCIIWLGVVEVKINSRRNYFESWHYLGGVALKLLCQKVNLYTYHAVVYRRKPYKPFSWWALSNSSLESYIWNNATRFIKARALAVVKVGLKYSFSRTRPLRLLLLAPPWSSCGWKNACFTVKRVVKVKVCLAFRRNFHIQIF